MLMLHVDCSGQIETGAGHLLQLVTGLDKSFTEELISAIAAAIVSHL